MEIVIYIDPYQVICDTCGKNFSDSDATGGFLLLSTSVCPECEPRLRKSIAKYNEEWSIKGECPEGVSFADWIRSIR